MSTGTGNPMDVIESVSGLQSRADAYRSAGRRIALVPTMGALHEGHLALVREAKRHADGVWVSIFVNPTQFGAGEDLSRYPRTLEADLAHCRAEGVDAVFLPDAAEMYPPGSQTWVEVNELAKPLCGKSRPEHFRGVATVVSKLFLAAKPHVAVFGEKDFQQLAVIRRMVVDLGFDVRVVGVPIVRESDGLALSSRNQHLDASTRSQALSLSRALDSAQRALDAGIRAVPALLHLVAVELDKAPAGRIDYAELRDPDSLKPVGNPLDAPTLLALAVVFMLPDGREVRLIDNRVLKPQPPGSAFSEKQP